MHWIFLILASICEMLWFYCIAYLNNLSFKELAKMQWMNNPDGWWTIVAIIGYAGFGVANMIFFAKSIQRIAPGVAFAVWTGVALAGITLSDAVFRGVDMSPQQIISIGLILIGVVGLKFYSKQ